MQSSGCLWLLAMIWSLSACSILLVGDIAQPSATLLETYWRVLEIDGKPVKVIPPGREPHLILKAEGQRVQGATGCNRFSGSFQKTDAGLRFQPLAATQMACPPPADALEQSFLQAIAAVRGYRLAGNCLELLDEQGNTRMRLEAQYLP